MTTKHPARHHTFVDDGNVRFLTCGCFRLDNFPAPPEPPSETLSETRTPRAGPNLPHPDDYAQLWHQINAESKLETPPPTVEDRETIAGRILNPKRRQADSPSPTGRLQWSDPPWYGGLDQRVPKN